MTVPAWRGPVAAAIRTTSRLSRGVAQPGRALGSGPRGRRFKSFRPDQKRSIEMAFDRPLWSVEGLFLLVIVDTFACVSEYSLEIRPDFVSVMVGGERS